VISAVGSFERYVCCANECTNGYSLFQEMLGDGYSYFIEVDGLSERAVINWTVTIRVF
jgi:hypothetical protein